MIKLMRKSAWRGISKVLVDGTTSKPAKITRSATGVVTIELTDAEGTRYLVHVINQADQERLGNAVHPAMRSADDTQLSGGTR